MTDRSMQNNKLPGIYINKLTYGCIQYIGIVLGKEQKKHNLDLVAILTLFEALRFEPLVNAVNEAEI